MHTSTLVGIALALAASVAAADSGRPEPRTSPPGGASAPNVPAVDAQTAPTAGRQFGEHVSGMAPAHPKSHGRLFGECVAEMATAGECPHHDEP